MSKGKIIRLISAAEAKENIVRFALRLLGLDGGPGSGNFGHSGRPGQVGGSGEGGGEGGSSKNSAYHEKLETERQKMLGRSQSSQAYFAFKTGIATEEEAVKAMDEGKASDLVNKYYDLMDYNGDPTPTKPIRKSPDLYSEIRNGEHGGDWTQARLDYIQDWAGMSEEEAKETYKQFETWFGGTWNSADTETIDKYIDQDGVYDGEIFRGMHFTEDEYQSFMSSVETGSQIGMNGHNSSWTTDRETAWGFARNGDRQVIITCKKNKTSAPVSHISSQGEDEVIAHSRTKWTVLSVQEGNNRTEITVVEAEDRMSEEERDRRKAQGDATPEAKDSSLEFRMNDQSRFFKVIPPPADLFGKSQKTADGGPGSGNWGHKGRPGQVGGSGKGGGKQYRGGRSDIAYVGSRKDWLNGLTGEKQLHAAKCIAKIRKEQESKKKAYETIELWYKQGTLTFDEKKARLKEAGLEKFDENMSPEEYTMKCGNNVDRDWLLGYIKEARNWNENRDKFVEENLSEDEKKLLEYAEKNLDTLDDDSERALYDLQAKAMGIPTSGEEAPDEMQYAAGTKERPQPEPAKGPDYSWYANNPNRHLNRSAGNLEVYSELATGGHPSYGHTYTQEEYEKLNQRLVDTMKYGNPSPNALSYYGIKSINSMRNAMRQPDPNYQNTLADFTYTPEMIDRLSSEEQKQLLDFMNRWGAYNKFSPVDRWNDVHELKTKDFEEIEGKIWGSNANLIRSKEAKRPIQDYILMQEKMLCGAVPSESNPFEAQKESEKKAEEERKKKLKEQLDKEQQGFQNSDAAKEKASAQDRVRSFNPNDCTDENGNISADLIAERLTRTGLFIKGRGVIDVADSPEQAVTLTNAYTTVAKDFPFMVGEFGDFKKQNSSDSYGSCCMDPMSDDGHVRITMSKFSDPEEARKKRKWEEGIDFKVKTDADCPAIKATAMHELGHAVDHWLHRAVYGGEYPCREKKKGIIVYKDYYSNVSEAIQKSTLRALKLSKKDIEKEVSKYATTDAQEFFAECFCEYYCSSNPRPVAVEFMKQLKKFIKNNNITDNTTANTPSRKPVFN